jgi:hypothetical protein
MKITYLCYWDLQRADGVADKIGAQISHWRAAGHEVDVFALAARDGSVAAPALAPQTFRFGGPADRLAATTRLATAARRSHADLVYLRYDVFLPTLAAAFGRSKLVVEMNSNVGAELQARSQTVARYERLQRRVLLGRADGAVAVTAELERELRRDRPSLATVTIANGIELGLVGDPARNGGGPRLVYIGESVYWQGVDKIVELAEARPSWSFDLVGVGALSVPANVTCHGFLARDEYAQLLERADVALGTLALHRKQMNEASPLKVRRYLEFGLPLILGYTDTDLAGLDPWWLLALPNAETNVRDSIAEIDSFVTAVVGRRVPRREVEPLISAAAKETRRLAFFESVAG